MKSFLLFLTLSICASAADIRVGIIGTDTSHVPAFTKLLNGDPSEPANLDRITMLAAQAADFRVDGIEAVGGQAVLAPLAHR